MRVTTASIHAELVTNLQATLAALVRQQDQLASGRRLHAPSDDPSGFTGALTLRSRQVATEQFRKNISEARNYLDAADRTVRGIAETIIQAKEHALQGANDSLDGQARLASGAAVDQLLETLVAQGNSKSTAGTYLFGGQETRVPPYTVTRNAAGKITTVAVNPRGIDGRPMAEVSEGATVETTVSGTTVFGAPADVTYAFDVLIRLRDALNTNDANTVRTVSLGQLDAVLDRVATPAAIVGARLNGITLLDEHLADESVAQAGALSRVEDVDLVRATIELHQLETAYEAALASSARLSQLSLLNFLR